MGFSLPVFALTIFVFAIAWALLALRRKKNAGKSARERVFSAPWIDANDLVDAYVKEGKYPGEDGPGCFIILVFDHAVTDGDYEGYRAIRIGSGQAAYESACKKMAEILYDETCGDGDGGAGGEGAAGDGEPHVYLQVRFYDKDVLGKRRRTLIELLNPEQMKEELNTPQED